MAYLGTMKVYKISSLGNGPSAADFFTIAVNKMEVNDSNEFALYVDIEAEGVTSLVNGTLLAGDNEGINQVTPEFFPYATEGAECAAFVTSLTWADQNLHDYEFVVTNDGTTNGYLVFGELNSTKTQFNDPFDASAVGARLGFVSAACWDASASTNFVV